MSGLTQDLLLAVRKVQRHPKLAAFLVLTLAIGIGTNTAIFSVVHALLLRSLPFTDPDHVVAVRNAAAAGLSSGSRAQFVESSESFQSIQGAATYFSEQVNLSWASDPRYVVATITSAKFFDVLGVNSILGRTFAPGDDSKSNDRLAVISYHLWQDGFGAERNAVGRTITLDGVPFTVLGVLPKGVGYPAGSDVWVPTIFDTDVLYNVGAFAPQTIARIKSDISVGQAQAELETRAKKSHEGELPGFTLLSTTLTETIRPSLLLLTGAVTLVLLITCANATSLMLTQAMDSRNELAIRVALGAGSGRLVRQQVTYSLVVTIAGGLAGTLFSIWTLNLLYSVRPADLESFVKPRMEWPVLAYATLLSLVAGIFCSFLPSWFAMKQDPSASLRAGNSHVTGQTARFRRWLVVLEVGLAFSLLADAALLVRSMRNLDHVQLGYATRGVLSVSISLHGHPYEEQEAVKEFYDSVLAELIRLPGVVAAGATNYLPLGKSMELVHRIIPARDLSGASIGLFRVVSPGYFDALGIPVISGRAFSDFDSSSGQRVVILNENLAKRFWPTEDPVGQHLSIDQTSRPEDTYTVIGVVAADRHAGPRYGTVPEYFLPFAQQSWPNMTFVIRTKGNPLALVVPVRRAVASIDRNQPIFDVQTMSQRLLDRESLERFQTIVLVAFACIAVLLAIAGLSGLISYSVAQRRRELGIRMALGAQPKSVAFRVMREALGLCATGLVFGMVGALSLARLFKAALFEVSTTDPLSLTIAAVLLLLASTAASYYPSRRAGLTDPAIILRCE